VTTPTQNECLDPVDEPRREPREEALITEPPTRTSTPATYKISNPPADIEPKQLTHLARAPWMIAPDHKQRERALSLHHYENHSYRGTDHHRAPVTAAHPPDHY